MVADGTESQHEFTVIPIKVKPPIQIKGGLTIFFDPTLKFTGVPCYM